MPGYLTRDRMAALAGVAAPLALAAVLVPFRDRAGGRDGLTDRELRRDLNAAENVELARARATSGYSTPMTTPFAILPGWHSAERLGEHRSQSRLARSAYRQGA
jgi:hypothetical protein